MTTFSCGEAESGGEGDSNGDPETGTTCDSQTKGFVYCGNNRTCTPGTYCIDNSFGECEVGCTSGANCGCGEVCEAGSCIGEDAQPEAKDCDTFCAKAEACGFPGCAELCTASSTACVRCFNDSNCAAGCEELCFL